MLRTRRFLLFALLAIVSLGSGCGLFHRCHTCPRFSQHRRALPTDAVALDQAPNAHN